MMDLLVVGQVIGTGSTLRNWQRCQGQVSIVCHTADTCICICTCRFWCRSPISCWRFFQQQNEFMWRIGEGKDQEKDRYYPTSTELHASWLDGWEGDSFVQYFLFLLSMCDHPVIHNNLTPDIDLLSLFCKKKPKLLQYTCFAKPYFSNVYSRYFLRLFM